MAKDARVVARVQNEQKEEWKKHVEEHGRYRDLTDLVEQSVEERVSRDSRQYTFRDQMDDLLGMLEEQSKRQQEILQAIEDVDETQATQVELDERAEDLKATVREITKRMGDSDD